MRYKGHQTRNFILPCIIVLGILMVYLFSVFIRHPAWEQDIVGSKVSELCKKEYEKVKSQYPEYIHCKVIPHSNAEKEVDIELTK